MIYTIKEGDITQIIKDYKDYNQYALNKNLEMTLEEELLFIYNIQKFLKIQKQKTTFKFLDDVIELSINRWGLKEATLLVNSKINYTHAKHYPIIQQNEEV
jgi:hypothetical protein